MEEKTFSSVPIPFGLDDRQVKIAQDFVVSRLQDGFTVGDFVQKHSLSTKTFYSWKASDEFNSYVESLNEILIPKDVLSAVEKFRLKVMSFVEKESMTKDEMNQFYNMFKPVIDASNRIEAEKLGLNINASSPSNSSAKSLSERKASLLSRLKLGTDTEKGDVE